MKPGDIVWWWPFGASDGRQRAWILLVSADGRRVLLGDDPGMDAQSMGCWRCKEDVVLAEGASDNKHVAGESNRGAVFLSAHLWSAHGTEAVTPADKLRKNIRHALDEAPAVGALALERDTARAEVERLAAWFDAAARAMRGGVDRVLVAGWHTASPPWSGDGEYVTPADELLASEVDDE